MNGTDYTISLEIQHRVRFTRGAFEGGNRMLAGLLQANQAGGSRVAKVLVFLEQAVAVAFPQLTEKIEEYFSNSPGFDFRGVRVDVGAEECKRNEKVLRRVWDGIEQEKVDRHSYVLVIGGGAFLDVVGFGAATAHRGVRLVRFPTTTLSQDDSGVGVKNGINAFGKKNWIGSFAVPYAVVNDFTFLHTQPEDIRRDGLVEAVKVALVRDGAFFNWLEDNAKFLYELKPAVLEEAVERSATLHAEHIALGGDPFETGSSRPLDFGHWSAHKLEQITDFALSHAEAVSVGVALDTVYSWRSGRISEQDAHRVLDILLKLGLPLYDEAFELRTSDGKREVIAGLEEFREHLGGELTVLLLRDIGKGEDVHQLDECLLDVCIEYNANYKSTSDSVGV
ncbi:MAG: 3-dehydroquinate synthase [Rubritalea sp.]|jgi:3-dehydroquinate synthase